MLLWAGAIAVIGLAWGAAQIGGRDGDRILQLPPQTFSPVAPPVVVVASPSLRGEALDEPTPTPIVATPTPLPDVPEPTPTVQGDVRPPVQGVAPSLEALICSYSWDCAVATRVFSCESGLQTDAISWNGSSYGIAQIWSGHAWRFPEFWETWMVPSVNIGWAHEIWSEQGWGPWRESRNCWWVP